jgi:phospholipase B1
MRFFHLLILPSVIHCVFSLDDIFDFNCPSLLPLTKPATSVHELRPQDIKVVMAMGDSVTAAFAALGEQHDIKDVYEYRGISWSIGGDPNSTTIPSLLKHYNPDLVGASIGSHFAEVHCACINR